MMILTHDILRICRYGTINKQFVSNTIRCIIQNKAFSYVHASIAQ